MQQIWWKYKNKNELDNAHSRVMYANMFLLWGQMRETNIKRRVVGYIWKVTRLETNMKMWLLLILDERYLDVRHISLIFIYE
jgi:hypothetical protein